MKRKFLTLWAMLILCVCNLQAQNWTWTGETPAAGNSYYLYTVNQNKFLNDNNGLDTSPAVLWTIGGTFSSNYTLTSSNNKQFAMYQTGGLWGIGATQYVETNATGKSGNDINLSGALIDGKYSIYRNNTTNWGGGRNVVSTSTGITRQSDASYEWYYITSAQVNVYNNNYSKYSTAYTNANGYKDNTSKLAPYLKSAIEDILTNYATVTYINIEKAITALSSLDYTETDKQIKAYDDNIDAYNTAKATAEKLKDNPLITGDAKTLLSNALATSVNGANIEEVLSALNAAVETAQSAMDAQIPYDASNKIVNPEAEDGTNGWIGEFGILGGEGAHFFEPAGWWKTSATMSQTVTGLPNGYYVLQMKYQAAEHVKVTLAGNTASNYVQGTNEGWKDLGVVCQVTDGTLAVTASSEVTDGETQFTWFNTDHFTLTYYGDADPGLTYDNGIKLDGSYLSRPAYTSTPADGVDPDHANDALLVVTYRDNYTNDPKTQWALISGAKAEVWADGAKVSDVDLLTDFRSSHYTNGFGLYIPNFDETKTYTVKVPANVFGYTAVGHGNEAFEVQAVASPLKDGKYFVVVKGTGKHVSRGKGWGTQAILDYYGVPMLVQTAGLTVFKFLDNNAFLGSDPTDDWLFTDINGSEANKVRRYILMPGEGEHEGEFQFYTPARDKYLSHVQNSIAGESYDAVNEGGTADYFQFEVLDAKGYEAHLAKIEEDEAIRVAARAGFVVNSKIEYDKLIEKWESKGFNTIFPTNDEEIAESQAYHEKHNDELACDATWEGTPRDLVGGEKVKLSLNKGLYVMHCDAFQQAMSLSTLQANQGFRGLTYMYVKVGNEMYKSQLKSITEMGARAVLPTDEATARVALDSDSEFYANQVIFYVPADGTQVEFGVENPQRLGNGIDATAGSWVAFKNIKVEKFNAQLAEANMKITAGKYGTFIAPFAVKLPAGVTAYTGELNDEKTSVALTPAASEGILAACTPVIVKNEGDAEVNITYREVDVRVDKTTVKGQQGVLVGFYKSYAEDNAALIQGDGNSWVLQTQNGVQAFYKVAQGAEFQGSKNRCYLVAPAAANGAKVLSFELADEETAIESLATGATIVEIYSANGTRLAEMQRGMNIIKMSNGQVKKVLVK